MSANLSYPSPANAYLAEHVAILISSYRNWGLGDLINPEQSGLNAARQLFEASFAVVSHNDALDPLFNYGNRQALSLFGMVWSEFTGLPSRLSAEPINQAEREHLIQMVRSQGYIQDYRGVRIAADGQRFLIENAVVWNMVGPDGHFCGQAACFAQWTMLDKVGRGK